MASQLQKLHTEWLEELEIGLGRSARTVAHYDQYLRAFYEAEEIKDIDDITVDAVRSFRRSLHYGSEDTQGVSLATQNYYFIALRQFLKYLTQQDVPCLAPDKIPLAKLPDREIDVLYPEEIDALLKAPLQKDDISAVRDKALLETLFATGLRVSEAVKLNRDDIPAHSSELTVRGKGNKTRIIFLSDDAKEAINNYVDKRTDVDPALFIRHKKGVGAQDDLRLTSRTVQRLIKHYAAVAGITKNITPHTLRHSFATDLLTNGADIRQVQALLGHSSITTTQVYTHITDKHLREVHEQFHRRK